MVDTNAILGIAFTIVSNFANVVEVPHGAVPTKVEDLHGYRIGSPTTPLDVFLMHNDGTRYWIQNGIVRNYSSSESYTQWHGLRPTADFQGIPTLTLNEAVSLATRTLLRLAKEHNRVAHLIPVVADDPEDKIPFYHIRWPTTNKWSKAGSAAFMEIDARKGLVTYLDLMDEGFYDYAFAQVISNKVYTPPPPKSLAGWERQFDGPLQRSMPYPTTNEVLEAISSWLRLCRKLGVDPGGEKSIDSVYWPRTMAYTNPEISTATHVCQVRFRDRACFESINGVAFSHYAQDACFTGVFDRMSSEEWARFQGKILLRWEDLAKHLEAVLVESVGIPRDLLAPFSPGLAIQVPEHDGMVIKRVVVNWRNWPRNRTGIVSARETTEAIRAEFDLETGELKWIDFEDPRFIGALRVAQEREMHSAKPP